MQNHELVFVTNKTKSLHREMSADRQCNPKYTKIVEWINDDLMNILQSHKI